jgi:hypothetical protein
MRRIGIAKRAIGGGVVAALAFSMWAAPSGASNIGEQGCTPGYWKNHTDAWADPVENDSYSPDQTLDDLFNFPDSLAAFRTVKLVDALDGGGGSGVTGATKILMRASVAAFLNAAVEDIGYPYRRFDEPGNMTATINGLLAGQDRSAIIAYATVLDTANNLGCPR